MDNLQDLQEDVNSDFAQSDTVKSIRAVKIKKNE